jgi:thiamine biosynthesis lipoprotein
MAGRQDTVRRQLELKVGALATSGDSQRFLLRNGVRYPHILNPHTAWPVMRAPRSVTVLGDTCTEAGLLATLAMLHGDRAEAFLAGQNVLHWIER